MLFGPGDEDVHSGEIDEGILPDVDDDAEDQIEDEGDLG